MGVTRRGFVRLGIGAGVVGVLGALGGAFGSAGVTGEAKKAYAIGSRPEGLVPAVDVAGYVGSVAGASSGVEDRLHEVRLRYTFVDASMVPAGMTFDEMFAEPERAGSAPIASYDMVATTYDVGLSDAYAVLVDPSRLGDGRLDVGDVTFTRDHDFAEVVEGCAYDAETGLAYVPRSAWLDEDGDERWSSLRIQVMVRVDATDDITSAPPVRVTGADGFEVTESPEVTDEGYGCGFSFAICAPERAAELGEENISVWTSGIGVRVDGISGMWSWDPSTGRLTVNVPGILVPGVEVLVTPTQGGVLSSALAPRRALAYGSWDEARFWPWGYVRYATSMDSMMANKTIFTYDCGGAVTAIDGTMIIDGAEAPGAAQVASYARNHIGELNDVSSTVIGTDSFDIDPASNEQLLQILGSADRDLSWDKIMYYYNYGDGELWGEFFRNAHFIVLPGCDIARNFTYEPAVPASDDRRPFWSTIKNCEFDNRTMIGTSAETNPRYNSCVIAWADCSHASRPTQDSGSYTGPVYCRIIGLKKHGDNPYVVISFHTNGFGSQDPHGVDVFQSAEVVLKFHLESTGYAKVAKEATV